MKNINSNNSKISKIHKNHKIMNSQINYFAKFTVYKKSSKIQKIINNHKIDKIHINNNFTKRTKFTDMKNL